MRRNDKGQRQYWDAKKRKCRLVSHKIMEDFLGRELLPEEVIHHKDGNTFNNELSNLELFETRGVHSRERHHEEIFGGIEGRQKGAITKRKENGGLLWCFRCQQFLTPENFNRCSTRWSGYDCRCKKCRREEYLRR